jgi:hypothetical protein
MMRTASEKLAIIRLVEDSELSVRRTLDEIKVSRTRFYRWYGASAVCTRLAAWVAFIPLILRDYQ